MALLGLIGWPLGHSISPRLHGAALQATGREGHYLPLAVPAQRLEAALCGLRGLPFRGVNVTIPHKEAVVAHLDEVVGMAQRLQAVNTIVCLEDGRLQGHNTDAAALVSVLGSARIEGQRVLVLGAGGAALAAAAAAIDLGAREVALCSRSPERARRVSERVGASVLIWGARHLPWPDVVINATPLGMLGEHEQETPLASLQAGVSFVFDLVYNPAETGLLRLAREHGVQVEGGLAMLVEQAALSYELWFESEAPRGAMRTAASAWLAGS